jgi:Flp pilus assembly protein CpaB
LSRRARALAFALAAAVCAAIAVSSVRQYSAGLATQLGPLRPAVVARTALPAKRAIGPDAARRLELRRVPARFLPPGALTAPAQAIGQAPRTAIPAGSYLLSAQLAAPRAGRERRSPRALGAGREPVEISVVGAAALAAGASSPLGRAVDVIVTSEPHGASGEGRTYVAAEGVRLLDLRDSGGDAGGGDGFGSGLPDSWVATLALRRSQALRLIQAQNFAREVRLVAHLGGR